MRKRARPDLSRTTRAVDRLVLPEASGRRVRGNRVSRSRWGRASGCAAVVPRCGTGRASACRRARWMRRGRALGRFT